MDLDDDPFTRVTTKDVRVLVLRTGRQIATVSGATADRLIPKLLADAPDDAQHARAPATGSERHPPHVWTRGRRSRVQRSIPRRSGPEVDASTANTGGQPSGRLAISSPRSTSGSMSPRSNALYRLPWLRHNTGSRLEMRHRVDRTRGAQHRVASARTSVSAQPFNVA